MEGSINSVQDLAKGHAIKYGVMAEGSTEAFFRVCICLRSFSFTCKHYICVCTFNRIQMNRFIRKCGLQWNTSSPQLFWTAMKPALHASKRISALLHFLWNHPQSSRLSCDIDVLHMNIEHIYTISYMLRFLFNFLGT